MGFVGSGFMGQLAHIANYSELEECELVALAEGRTDLAQKVASRYGIKKVYKNHRELAADNNVEAVAAIFHYSLNYSVAKDLLLAGKHLITEKPIALSSREASELVDLANKKNLIYQVGYMKRYDNGVKLFKNYLSNYRRTKEYGELQLIRIWSFIGNWKYGIGSPITTDEKVLEYECQNYPAWMPEKYHGFYSRLLNMESHDSNLLRYLIEEGLSIEYVSYDPKNPVNYVIIAITESGTRIVFECGKLSAHRLHEGLEFYFNDAILKIQLPSPMDKQSYADVEIYLAGEKQEILRPIPQPGWAFMNQAKHFLRSVRKEESPVSPASEAVKEITFCEEAIRFLMQK